MNKYNYIFLFNNNICEKIKALRRDMPAAAFLTGNDYICDEPQKGGAKETMERDCDDGMPDDGQLLALHAQDGTNRWLGQLYSRYLPLVYGVCLKYLRNPDDAGDAVMDIFEELTVKVGRYEVERFRPWLYTLAKNHCLQRLRRQRLEIPADDAGRIMEYAPLVHLLDGEGDEARFAALERCLERLPEKQRECIDRFFYGGKSYADISAETCWPVKSIKSFLQNGKRNLKLCMEKEADETD